MREAFTTFIALVCELDSKLDLPKSNSRLFRCFIRLSPYQVAILGCLIAAPAPGTEFSNLCEIKLLGTDTSDKTFRGIALSITDYDPGASSINVKEE
jgi:hypothetical protein